MTSRQFTPADLPPLLEFVSVNAAKSPRRVYLMTSDIAWRWPGAAPERNVRLWWDAAGLAGYAWFEPTVSVEFDVRHDLTDDHTIVQQMLKWGESRRHEFAPAYPRFIDLTSMEEWANEIVEPRAPQPWEGLCLTTIALESDSARIEQLQRSGFDATPHCAIDYRRDLVAIPSPKLADGMMLRHVGENELDARVACHRAAWLRSTWSMDSYLTIRTSNCYDPELDIVLEAADSVFVSYCICWADHRAGIGSFEPVGTRPEWRGRGVGREIIYEGLRRLKAKGMHTARVGTAGFNAPAQALYEACGFERVDVARTFMKRVEQ
jgi:ribosomal protein S18 acetylase RimI-like enzyme